MKKFTFTLFAITPMVLFAQAPAPSPATGEIGRLLIIILVLVIIFFICRELICWYYKINKMVSNKETIQKLVCSIIGVGVSSNEDAQNESVSRIKFSLPMLLPNKEV